MGSPGQILKCPTCQHSNPPGTLQCARCSTPFVGESQTLTGGIATGWTAAAADAPLALQTMEPGAVVAGRYEIIKLLGEGGMGAVYKARDRELERLVALKVIRPELAGHPSILQRFKQELILAREVTHRNVIRIFDLGVAGQLKFITMEFVEGRDLSAILEDRRPSVEETIQIVRQVARALEAAHTESVVHRDLKPQNIMVGDKGKVSVMDFGLARTLESTGLTQTGAILGTPLYMSPEQAQGTPVDARSDLFSLGIIFYEMLTGTIPFKADSVLASMLRRTQGPPRTPAELSPSIPGPVSDVVMKCLAIDPANRYQSATQLLVDLDALAGGTPVSITAASQLPTMLMPAAGSTATAIPPVSLSGAMPPAAALPPRSLSRRYFTIAAAATLVAVAAGGLWFFSLRSPKPAAGPAKPVTLLVADFSNQTGEPIFNGTLEPMFTLALEGASFVTTVRHDQALRIARQLQPDATGLNEQLARLVAVREGIAVVVSGAIRHPGAYEISVRAIDAVTGQEISHATAQETNKEGVLGTIGKLSAGIRASLGDITPESAQLAAAETFTAGSLEAAQAYSAAQDLRFAGKGEEAIKAYQKVITLDPNFGSAYGSLAAMYANLGQREEATKYYKLAMARIDRMTDREKYRTRGGYYLNVMDPQKAIEELTALVKQYPADTMGLSSLAFAYYLHRDMPKALEEGRRALAIYPKNVPYRNNVALYALYAGDFDTSVKEATAALQQNPAYLKGYITLALAELTLGRPREAMETYRKLEGVSAIGASFAATGLADLALFEGRPEDALGILEKAAASELAAKNSTAAAKKLVMSAEAHMLLGHKAQALAALDKAVSLAKESVLFAAARVYVEAGQDSKARALAAGLESRFEPVPQAYAKVIQAEIELRQGRGREAIKTLDESVKLSDTWLARYDMGRAFLAAEDFTRADSQFDLCIKRRGEATDVLLDEAQTYRVFPAAHYYLGRAREGLRSSGAVDSYKTFLAMKAPSAHDPLVEDARRRAAR